MSELRTPLRDYLQNDFNAFVNEQGLDSHEAYTVLKEGLAARGLHYDTYAQATITSGGHARNTSLDWLEIVQRNVAYAQEMASELYANGQLNPRSTIEAATLGLISHWKEKDYITFWFNTLAQPDTSGPGSAAKTDRLRRIFDADVHSYHIDFSKFNDYSLTNDERAHHYMRYADMAVAAMQEFGDFSHVDRLVAVSETVGSLGASTERYFTKKLGGAVFNLAIAHFAQHPLQPGDAHPTLVRDTSELVHYGAQIFDPRRGQQIVLLKED